MHCMWIKQFFWWTRTRALSVQSKQTCRWLAPHQCPLKHRSPGVTGVGPGDGAPVIFFVKHVWRQSDSRSDTPLFQMCLLVMWVMCHVFFVVVIFGSGAGDIGIKQLQYHFQCSRAWLLCFDVWQMSLIHTLQIVRIHEYLVGGLKYFCIFTPIWGNDPIWLAYFSDGLKPPTRYLLHCPSWSFVRVPELFSVYDNMYSEWRLLLSLGPMHYSWSWSFLVKEIPLGGCSL